MVQRNLLRTEMTDAFEQRKHQARRLGEEAGTKLLLPLFILLSVVMVMIAVPALMELYSPQEVPLYATIAPKV